MPSILIIFVHLIITKSWLCFVQVVSYSQEYLWTWYEKTVNPWWTLSSLVVYWRGDFFFQFINLIQFIQRVPIFMLVLVAHSHFKCQGQRVLCVLSTSPNRSPSMSLMTLKVFQSSCWRATPLILNSRFNGLLLVGSKYPLDQLSSKDWIFEW